MLLLLAAATALLALTIAGQAFAQPAAPKKPKARPFVCQAVVTAVDASGSTLRAKVVRAARPMKARIGTEVTFTVVEKALILKVGKDVDPAIIELSAVAVNDRVLIRGRIDRTDPTAPVFNARMIVDRGPVPSK
jgi:hypothetical protein